MSKSDNIIRRFKGKRLLVIGDLVLDQYIKGSVSRISPEAPVPIVLQEESFYTPGGAANVANNLASLGADVTLLGKIGDDIEGNILKAELHKRHIRTQGIFIDSNISTIFKTRIIAQHQQVVRLDREKLNTNNLDLVKEGKILPFISRRIKDFDAVIVSDYGKGLIDPRLLAQVHEAAFGKKIAVVIDPKLEDLREYGQVTCITPNKKEAETSLKTISVEARKAFGIRSTKLEEKQEIEANGSGLLKYLNIDSLLITLGEHGMYLFEHDKKPFPIPTMARQIFDVSGAGDTVISVFTLCLACEADKPTAAKIANYAAGIVIGKMGAVAVELDELKQAIGEGEVKTLGLIPARMGSTRFPGKMLADIGGKPLIQHVWEKAVSCQELDGVLIACDHEDILKAAQGFKAQAVMTDPQHPSGSDRIAEAVGKLDVENIINIQGDEPFIDPRTIDQLAFLLKDDKSLMMATVVKEIDQEADFQNPNVVKCVLDEKGYAMYFSRSPIPYHRHHNAAMFPKNYKHLGLYAYHKNFLMEFTKWPKSKLESVEGLEQLRALEHGVKIKTIITNYESIAVDTPQDLEKANEWYAKLKLTTK